jgi:hypothetical protein
MKKNCTGCIALDLETCRLGHLVKITGNWPQYRYHPTEECEKPKTIRKYIELIENKNPSIRG